MLGCPNHLKHGRVGAWGFWVPSTELGVCGHLLHAAAPVFSLAPPLPFFSLQSMVAINSFPYAHLDYLMVGAAGRAAGWAHPLGARQCNA